MADITYRANLKAATFPFLSELFGRSVIVKGPDQNYIGGLATKESLDSSIGVPQIYYCHNVIPTDSGYKSVGYVPYTVAAYPSTARFTDSLTLRDDLGNSAQLSTDAVGNIYVMQKGTSTWSNPTGGPAAAAIAGKRVSIAFVSGITYIYFANVACYIYNWGANSLTIQALAGLVAADIIGVVGNSGYLLAYSTTAIAWSSTILPTDFVPDLATGAGGGNVEGIRGEIVTIEEVYGGMIIFAAENAVAGIASGNVRYPYNFIAITGSGGLTSSHNTSQDTGAGSLYAYTTSGLQILNLKNATPAFAEVTDFLSGSLLEDFNELTKEFELIDASGQEMLKRIALIADRYLIISYGLAELTYAFYFDIAYKQFGKLKTTHVDCFEFVAHAPGTVEVPKRSIAFLTAGGGINILNPDIVGSGVGVMLLGKYQLMRQRLVTFQGAVFENIEPTDTCDVYCFPTYDGKTFEPAVALSPVLPLTGKVRQYRGRVTGVNFTLGLIGAFNAISHVLTMSTNGKR